MIVVAHNLAAMNTQRQFNITDKKKTKNVEKLASGYKVNRAADDAAGLSISEKMRNQIRGLNQAMSNIEDGISFCKVGEGALNEVHAILGRIEELAVQAANDVNDDDDRKAIDNEVQELKSEMKKIFRTTEFNGKRYWVEPYVPEVSGDSDFMVYNSDSDEHNGYGGMIVNGIRYSWDDLGVTFDDDGYFSTNDNTDNIITDYKGEQIAWETSPAHIDEDGNVVVEKDMPPNIRRLYTWYADENGISVNGINAISRADFMDIKPEMTSEGAFYSIKYKEINIEFMVPNSDLGDWDAICDGLNGKAHGGFDSIGTWEAILLDDPAIIADSVSFSKTQSKQVLYISDGWKDKVADRSNYYSLDTMHEDSDGDGHGDGIRLVDNGILLSDDNDSNSHTNTEWKDMSDPSAIEEYSNGGYPIVDWGTDYDSSHMKNGSTENDITLNEKATYYYRDNVTGYTVGYNLTDEVSLENMENELRGAVLSTKIYAPTTTTIKNNYIDISGKQAAALIEGNTNMTYALQRDSGKSFGVGSSASNEEFNMHYGVSSFSSKEDILAADKITLNYDLYKTGTDEKLLDMESSISRDTLRDMVKYGGTYTFSFSNSKYMNGMKDMDGDGYSDVEGELLDDSVRYEMDYTMTLKVDKIYNEPDYNSVIRNAYKNAQDNAAGNNDAADALLDKLCKIEHPDWYAVNENGTLSDNILPEHTNDRNNYSTLGLADALKNISADDDNNYKFSYNGHSFKLSQSERDMLVGWRNTAENKYNSKMDQYKKDLDNQYVSVYNLLKNADLSTVQKEHPRQEVTFSEIKTQSRHNEFDFKVNTAKKHMFIQTGANSGEHQEIKWDIMSLSYIGMNGAQTLTRESATNTISKVQAAVKIVSRERSNFGAHQVRLERAYDNNANYSENLQNAESNIRDTDMAKEMVALSKNDILQQAAQSMLAHANQLNQGILQLIQS